MRAIKSHVDFIDHLIGMAQETEASKFINSPEVTAWCDERRQEDAAADREATMLHALQKCRDALQKLHGGNETNITKILAIADEAIAAGESEAA